MTVVLVIYGIATTAALGVAVYGFYQAWQAYWDKSEPFVADGLSLIRECERLGIPWEDCVNDPDLAREQLARTVH